MTLDAIHLRDPFVLADKARRLYYLYGTTDPNPWDGPATGFDTWRSRDLLEWEGPFPAFRPPEAFWGTTQYWAPEVYALYGKYYLFGSFKGLGHCRGTQVMVSEGPEGPFVPWSHGPLTPESWECLDGTLFQDDTGQPWLVFCREWLEVGDGEIYATRLARDLQRTTGDPNLLFRASSAPWVRPVTQGSHSGFVTDGPFLWSASGQRLQMLWSSHTAHGYAMGIAESLSGRILGPWVQNTEPIFAQDGGHGMIFETWQGDRLLTIHQPNFTPYERPRFFPWPPNRGYSL